MICPYCKQKMDNAATLQAIINGLPTRQKIIFNAVGNSGSNGVDARTILGMIYVGAVPPPGAATILRVQVHELNKKIRKLGKEITRGRGGPLRLVNYAKSG